jgi:hypothetical protein
MVSSSTMKKLKMLAEDDDGNDFVDNSNGLPLASKPNFRILADKRWSK